MDKDRALDRLKRLGSGLREQFPLAEGDPVITHGFVKFTDPNVWLGLEDARWLVRAIDAVIAKTSRLDEALGLTRAKGRPRSRANALLCQVWADAPEGTSQLMICKRAYEKYPDIFKNEPDPRQLQRAIWKKEKGVGVLTKDAEAALANAEKVKGVGVVTNDAFAAMVTSLTAEQNTNVDVSTKDAKVKGVVVFTQDAKDALSNALTRKMDQKKRT